MEHHRRDDGHQGHHRRRPGLRHHRCRQRPGWSIDGTFQCVSDFYADKNNGTGDYLDNVVKQITFNIDGEEEKCAVPMGYAPTSVWYNTDMWKAAGLTDKDIPTTWDQLLEVAKKLTKSDGSQYGLAMADSGWAAYMKGNGTGLYTTDGKVSINSKENKAFLQKMRDFYNGGYASRVWTTPRPANPSSPASPQW